MRCGPNQYRTPKDNVASVALVDNVSIGVDFYQRGSSGIREDLSIAKAVGTTTYRDAHRNGYTYKKSIQSTEGHRRTPKDTEGHRRTPKDTEDPMCRPP